LSAAPPLLSLEGVRKGYDGASGRVEILRGADLSLPEGGLGVLTGPSGSGKTTLLGIAGLLLRADAGRVVFRGRETGGMDERARSALRAAEIGMVFQKFCLLPRRNVLENVLFRFRYARGGGGRNEERRRAEEALERVGMADKAKRAAGVLSAGEMQRVAIARAIAAGPALLLADEPTGNLDEANAAGVMALFCGLHRDGTGVLVVTHNPAWTRLPGALCLRMEAGRTARG